MTRTKSALVSYEAMREAAGPVYRALAPVCPRVEATGALRRKEPGSIIEFVAEAPGTPPDMFGDSVRDLTPLHDALEGVLAITSMSDRAIKGEVRIDDAVVPVAIWLVAEEFGQSFPATLFRTTGPRGLVEYVFERLERKRAWMWDEFVGGVVSVGEVRRPFQAQNEIALLKEAGLFYLKPEERRHWKREYWVDRAAPAEDAIPSDD